MLPVQQGEAWVQPVTEAYAVSITIACTSSMDQPAGPPQITSTNPCTTAYKPSLFDSQTQSQESRSRGCCICRSSTCSWTFNTWPIEGQT